MLNINLCDETPLVIKELIAEWRRTHVSRFPVEVVSDDGNPLVVRFVDSRFPTKRNNRETCIAVLDARKVDIKNRRIYALASRLIQNEKYATHNSDYHVKETTDPKKLLKLLREYAKPFTALEIMHKLGGDVSGELATWRDQPRYAFNEMVSELRAADIAEELIHLQSIGVQFRSDKFRRVVSEGISLYEEANRRKHTKLIDVHVYVQPDSSVMVTTQGASKEGSWTYQTLEEAPTCVQQQVAMLRLCDMSVYVPEVGRKVRDDNYWIHVHPDDFNP